MAQLPAEQGQTLPRGHSFTIFLVIVDTNISFLYDGRSTRTRGVFRRLYNHLTIFLEPGATGSVIKPNGM